MELKNEEKNSAEDFASDIETKNIWTQDEEKDESDIPAFLRRRKRNKRED